MDPTLPVHIISGFLPIKKIQLSSELVSASLGKLKQEIPVFPVLTGTDQIQLPFPKLPERTWSWVRVRENCYIEEELEKQPSETAFETTYPLKLTEGWLKLSEG